MNLGDFIVVKVSCSVLEKHAKSSIWIYNGQEWKFYSHLSLGCESKQNLKFKIGGNKYCEVVLMRD
jgi:hypothetical protein